MNFTDFQSWREQQLQADPGLLDCGETNLYRALSSLQPVIDTSPVEQPVYRCDLARAWLARYGFAADRSRDALVCRGVRHALDLIFRVLAEEHATLWLPSDVYPVYLELALTRGIKPRTYATLPAPNLPSTDPEAGDEYLLIANPWKPLGRYLTGEECASIMAWLSASARRYVLMDCVYDFGTPFHATTQELLATGRAVLLHSVTKGWLWPRTFGIALVGENHARFAPAFRAEPPGPTQLRMAATLLSAMADCPVRVAAALEDGAAKLLAAFPVTIADSLLGRSFDTPGRYFFPVDRSIEELRRHRILGIPASVFGATDWSGSILTSLSPAFLSTINGAAT
jgi:hypothetical protein